MQDPLKGDGRERPNVTDDSTIRRYQPGDEDRIADVIEIAHREADAWVGDMDGELDEDLDAIEEEYFPEGEFLVAELEGRIVGSIAFHPPGEILRAFYDDFGDAAAQIKRFSVAPDYQRRGVGRALYDELERRARKDGIETFVLHTTGRTPHSGSTRRPGSSGSSASASTTSRRRSTCSSTGRGSEARTPRSGQPLLYYRPYYSV